MCYTILSLLYQRSPYKQALLLLDFSQPVGMPTLFCQGLDLALHWNFSWIQKNCYYGTWRPNWSRGVEWVTTCWWSWRMGPAVAWWRSSSLVLTGCRRPVPAVTWCPSSSSVAGWTSSSVAGWTSSSVARWSGCLQRLEGGAGGCAPSQLGQERRRCFKQ
jgi:hypothetical protein